jgi:hypothetical protein
VKERKPEMTNRTKYQTNPEYALTVDRATAYVDQLCQVASANLRARPDRRWDPVTERYCVSPERETWAGAYILAMHTAERIGLR